MNVLLCSHGRRIALCSWTRGQIFWKPVRRSYATHKGLDTSNLSQSLDTRSQPYRSRDSVGPFQLGISQSSLERDQKVKRWSELNTAGKVQRTTARTTNLAVILIGAGLSAVLIYCLTSELFSQNSPTVLHDDACKRIQASTQLSRHLRGPLKFHNTPPSSVRPRHRNHHVASQVMVDSTGREHMLLNFYVEGKPPGTVENTTMNTFEWMKDKAFHVSDMTWDDAVQWSQQAGSYIWTETIRTCKYLTGSPLPPGSSQETLSSGSLEKDNGQKSSAWQLTGMFSSLWPSKVQLGGETLSNATQHTEGEVHADLIRNSDGYFVYRYLLVDIPNSRSRNSTRVFIERVPGMKDNEPVVRWNAS